MPDLPQLAILDHCPDEDCRVPIGTSHLADCRVAICVSTGQQRILHADDHHVFGELPRNPHGGLDLAALDSMDSLLVDVAGGSVHVCGEDVWTGRRHGTVEAAAYGLFVRWATDAEREATDDGPAVSGWIPCEPGEPGAVPDLDRVVREGRWNPIRQVWELTEVAGV